MMTMTRMVCGALMTGSIVIAATTFAAAQSSDEGSPRGRWEAYRRALHAAGEPLTMAELEALRPKLPPTRNGAAVIEKLANELDAVSAAPSTGVPFFDPQRRGFDSSSGVPSDWVEPMRDFLKRHAAVIERLETLQQFDDGCLSGDWYKSESDNPLEPASPTIRRWEVAARLRHLESLAYLVDGRLEKSAEAVAGQFRVAATLRHEPDSAVWMMRLRILTDAVSATQTVLYAGALERSTLDRLAALIELHAKSLSLADVLRFDRVYLITVFDALVSGKLPLQDLVGAQTMELMGSVSREDLYEAQLAVTKTWTDFIEIADDPVKLVAHAKEAAERDSPDTMSAKQFNLAGIHTATMDGDANRNAQMHAELRCARVALAAERFRLEKGRWPQSLNELKATLSEAVWTDPFDGKPLRLIERDGGIVIYSVGADLVDDKANLTIPEGDYLSPDTGFRLIPPDKRGSIVISSDSGP